MNFLITFIVLSIVNVIFSTVKSILTVKGTKAIASLVSGSYYAFYNIMIIYTVANFSMWQKCLITFICNIVGVFLVKWIEEKFQKEKLWKVEVTVPKCCANEVHNLLQEVSHSYIEVGKYTLFNFYCETQKDSSKVKEIVNKYGAKYFVAESKNL